MLDASLVEQRIKSALPDADVTVRDLTGTGDHFEARVVAAAFEGKGMVEQHQLVYAALKGQMGGILHALALQTGVPGG